MSIQILLEPESKNNKSLDLYCNKIEANDFRTGYILADTVNTTNLIVSEVGYPATALPRGTTVMSGSNISLGYAVSPHLLCGTPSVYNIPFSVGDGLDVAGGSTGQVFQSSSIIDYGDGLRYNYKVCGLMTTTQPFTGYYLKLGGVVINAISSVNYIMNTGQKFVEIEGSFTITSGFPLSTDMTSNMTVKFSDEYTAGIVVPTASVQVSNIVAVSNGNFGINPVFSVAIGSSGGTTGFSCLDSVLQCSFSPVNP